jgi:hypothetical protein
MQYARFCHPTFRLNRRENGSPTICRLMPVLGSNVVGSGHFGLGSPRNGYRAQGRVLQDRRRVQWGRCERISNALDLRGFHTGTISANGAMLELNFKKAFGAWARERSRPCSIALAAFVDHGRLSGINGPFVALLARCGLSRIGSSRRLH